MKNEPNPTIPPRQSEHPLRSPLILDTSAWIQAFNEDYSPDIFESLWVDLGQAVLNGVILVPSKAWQEIHARADGLSEWIKPFEGSVIETDDAIEAQAAAVIARFPALVLKTKPTARSEADAWIIATAIVRSGSIITKEGYVLKATKTAMPNVCEAYNVPWARLSAMLRFLEFHY